MHVYVYKRAQGNSIVLFHVCALFHELDAIHSQSSHYNYIKNCSILVTLVSLNNLGPITDVKEFVLERITIAYKQNHYKETMCLFV